MLMVDVVGMFAHDGMCLLAFFACHTQILHSLLNHKTTSFFTDTALRVGAQNPLLKYRKSRRRL